MGLGSRYAQHSFSMVPQANIQRSKFDRSFPRKDTWMFDQLTPVFLDEILPGDTINLTVQHFIRLATQQVPVLDNMYLDFFFFFVPNRLVWENWERFMGAQDNPGASTDYLIPQVLFGAEGSIGVGTLADKFALPTDIVPTGGTQISVNALPFRAYNLIFNDWFRDQNLQNSLTVPTGDGPDSHAIYMLQTPAKKHDYFTSALPWPQKGDAVTLSVGGTAPVIPNGDFPEFDTGLSGPRGLRFSPDNHVNYYGTAETGQQIKFANQTGLQADLSEATAVTINQLRMAIMTQSLLELDARGGTRYVELLRSHFNVISPDFRLQRPEFLSSATVRINQHPIAQTSESGTTPQANLAAYSTSSNYGNQVGFTKSFVEHGYVMGLVRARADITYQQGLNRMWSRQTKYDFFWPKLQELGEQTILKKEINFLGIPDSDESVFGYAERYAEYRYRPGEICGQFRSTFDESLDVWHLSEALPIDVGLNSAFIGSSTPIERVLAVADGYPHLLADMWFDYKHIRPMVTYAIPATLGRF